jgi:NAD(P)-dependent dehydrogenase (short-subunit alcohol dehydrogenase family)
LSETATRRPVACVTGASRRVGRAIALELARRGCDLAATYRESADEARSLVADAMKLGAAARVDRLDLNDAPAVEAYAAALASGRGRGHPRAQRVDLRSGVAD